MPEVPHIVAKCTDPGLRAVAKRAFDGGSLQDQGHAIRAIIAHIKQSEQAAKKQKLDVQTEQWETFIKISLKYMYEKDG